MSEPYENTLSLEELRQEVRRLWDEKDAFTFAVRDLPEIPELAALRHLTDAAMSAHVSNSLGRAIELQRKHGLDLVPPKSELECAAVLWSVIRNALLVERAKFEVERAAAAILRPVVLPVPRTDC